MRLHHIIALALLALATLLIGSCADQPTQTGTLCAGECPKKPAELLPVAWGRAIYLPSPGVEFRADIVDMAPDGVAELLITGLADTPAPDKGDASPTTATHPDSITVAVPCLRWTGPAALARPLGVAWAWPTDSAADARAGAFAGTMADGSVRVAIGGDPVEVLVLPALALDGYPVWIPDPSAKPGSHAATWEAACRAGK